MPARPRAVQELQRILDANEDKRICIVGTFCCGKSTLARELKGVRDMDEIVFPRLTDTEVARVNRPWSPEVGHAMTRIADRCVTSEPGQAVIGTVLLACDLVVRLRITDQLLRERTKLRDAPFADAKALDKFIDGELEARGSGYVEVDLG